MKLAMIAVGLLFAVGCHVTTSTDHVLVNDLQEVVPAGQCAPVEGPFGLPSGTFSDYTVTDLDGTDVMDVTIVDDSLGCDFADGFGTALGITDHSDSTGDLPSGTYDFVVRCNVAQDCIFDLTWTASY